METFLPSNSNLNRTQLLKYYHGLRPRLKYKDICMVLNEHHNISITERQVKEFFKQNNLTRKRNVSNDVAGEMIRLELSTSVKLLGYRQMTELLSVKYEINISRENVRILMKEIDPVGVGERRRRTIKRRIYGSLWSLGDLSHRWQR